MNDTPLFLPRMLVNRLLHWAQLFPDQVALGLIGANSGRARTFYPLKANFAANDGQAGFLVALEKLHEGGEALFALFFSHPRDPALPSDGDPWSREYPDLIRLIVSLNTKGVLELRAFRLGRGGESVREVELHVTDMDH